jgi:hypothetical protein
MESRTISTLEIGETKTFPIRARPYWNDTGISVHIGERYRLRADGSWTDFFITSGPDGYKTPWWNLGQRLAVPLRRVPNARWFTLIGAVRGAERRPFVIGRETETVISAAGTLKCFANDVPGFYWNNCGAIRLSIERLS